MIRIMETRNELGTLWTAVHPGSVLGEELKERGISQKDFAKAIGMPASNLNEIIKGKRNITAATAYKLEEGLGISSKFWLDMQHGYFHDQKILTGKPSKRSKLMSLSIPADLYERLTSFSAKAGITITEFLNKAIDQEQRLSNANV